MYLLSKDVGISFGCFVAGVSSWSGVFDEVFSAAFTRPLLLDFLPKFVFSSRTNGGGPFASGETPVIRCTGTGDATCFFVGAVDFRFFLLKKSEVKQEKGVTSYISKKNCWK